MKAIKEFPTDEKKTTKTGGKDKITHPKATDDAFVELVRNELNVDCRREFRFHPQRRWRFDYALPKCLVAVEVEGGVWTRGRHVNPKGFLRDMEKYNTATLMGWSVLRVTPQDLYTEKTLQMLKTAVFGSN